MGFMTLEDFRNEVSEATGQRGFNNPRLDRWINFGYLDISGAIKLEELEEVSNVNTVNGTATIAKPSNAKKVLSVVDDTNGHLLRNIDKTEYFRLDRTQKGDPKKWASSGESIYLHPTPDAVNAMLVISQIEPDALSSTGDTTILDKEWDAAVLMLAIHYAYMGVSEDQRAILWLNRAISYIQSRVSSEEIFIREPGLGLSMAVPKERLIAAMEGGLSGNAGAQ